MPPSPACTALPRTDEILDATRGSALHVARIDLAGAAAKEALLGAHRAGARVPGMVRRQLGRAGGLPERPVLDDGGAATCC